MTTTHKKTSKRLAALAARILRLDASTYTFLRMGWLDLINVDTGEHLAVRLSDITALAGCVVAQAQREEAETPKRRKGK